jgi:hypothetical protein
MEGEVIAEALSLVDVIVYLASGELSEHFQQGQTTDGRKNELV